MPLPDPMYCSQQINIPPDLADILKHFTKAAIRTQPKDILVWSAAYFAALSKGETLPIKDRLEMNVAHQKTDTGLTPGLLKTLHKLLGSKETCSKDNLEDKWKALSLPNEQMQTLLQLGNFSSDIAWMEFFALGCSALGGTLMSALKIACEILTKDEEGGAARIPFSTFVQLYTYLAYVDGDLSKEQIDNFLKSLQPEVSPGTWQMWQSSVKETGQQTGRPQFRDLLGLHCELMPGERQHGMIKPMDFIHQEDMDSPSSSSSEIVKGATRSE